MKKLNYMNEKISYTDAIALLDFCIENKLIKEVNGEILVFRESRSMQGWFFIPKEDGARDLMEDDFGVDSILNKLNEVGLYFTATSV